MIGRYKCNMKSRDSMVTISLKDIEYKQDIDLNMS